MGVSAAQFSSTYTISMTNNNTHVETAFAYTPVLKSMPVGLWGQSTQSDPNAPQFVDNALAGFEIRPAAPPDSGGTAQIERSKLLYDPEVVSSAYAWTTPTPFQSQTLDDSQSRQIISSSIASTAVETMRQQISVALGITADIELDQTVAATLADAFVVSPQIELV
jgi:hypothetical protein